MYQELENPHYKREVRITICLLLISAIIVTLFIIFDGRSTDKTDELGKPYYYLWSSQAFIDTEKTLSRSNKISDKAYWVKEELAGDYSKLKDMADFITEEKGYLLFNPVVKKEDFISTTGNPNIKREPRYMDDEIVFEAIKHPVLPRVSIVKLGTNLKSISKDKVSKFISKPLTEISSNSKLITMQVIPTYLGGADISLNTVYVTEECAKAFDEVYARMLSNAGKDVRANIEVEVYYNGDDDEHIDVATGGYKYRIVGADRALIPDRFRIVIKSKENLFNDECVIYNKSDKFKFDYKTGDLK